MNLILITIAGLIVIASLSLFDYLVVITALAFGVTFTFCLMTNRLLTEFIYKNSVTEIKTTDKMQNGTQ